MGPRYPTFPENVDIGSNDCKNNLIGIIEAFEFLLQHNFQPKRTILAAFGFDEEIRFAPQRCRVIIIEVVIKVQHIYLNIYSNDTEKTL